MAGLDREQILAMKRQLEEEFRLDMAAIERLERRFMGPRDTASSYLPPSPAPSNVSVLETRAATPRSEAKSEPAPQPDTDELEGTLRTMFSNFRK